MLSNCEAQFVSVPLRGNSLLPEWLREGQQQQAGARDAAESAPAKAAAGHKAPKGQVAGAAATAAAATAAAEGSSVSTSTPAAAARPHTRHPASLPPVAAGAGHGSSGSGGDGMAEDQHQQGQAGLGGKQAAEAVAEALRAAGCKPVGVRQLLFGDWVVVYRFQDSGQAAVLPWLPWLRAANEPGRAVGSALATLRVLAAKGFPVVLAGEDGEATVAECLDLWT
jgi:hypothetical protein